MICNFIFYVRDQEASTHFYRRLLNQEPTLNVPGMSEFKLSENCTLGLMPEKGILRLLGEAIEDPAEASGVPRAEIYLSVSSPQEYMSRAEVIGARLLSPLIVRNWGDIAG
ncbi:MAG: glyoxalase [Bdellovibrionales bacterium]